MNNTLAVIGVPSAPPVQTISVPIPNDPVSLALLVAFGVSEILPFLGGRFKRFNGLFQTLTLALRALKPLRREDEAVAQLREEIESLRLQVQGRTTRRPSSARED